MKRKILSILSAAALLLMLLPAGLFSVLADEAVPGMYEDFENLTAEQAGAFFVKDTGDSVITSLSADQGVNGSKALDVQFELSQGWVKQKHPLTEVQGDVMMVTFTLSHTTEIKLGLRNSGKWMDPAYFFAGDKDNYETLEAGTYTRLLSLEGITDISAMEIVLDIGGGSAWGVTHHIYFDEFRFCEIEKYVDAEYMTNDQAQDFVVVKNDGGGAVLTSGIVDGHLQFGYTGSGGWFSLALGPTGFQKLGLGMFLKFDLAGASNEGSNGLRVAIADDTVWNQEFVNGIMTAGAHTYFTLWDDTALTANATLDFHFDDWRADNTVTILDCYYVMPLSDDGTPGDTTELQAALDEYQAIYENGSADYTEDTFAAFQAAYESAQALVDSGTATATQLREELKKLEFAYNSLRPLSFVWSNLKAALDAADAFFADDAESKYTAHSLGMIQDVYDDAEAMYDGQTADTQRQIDDMVIALNTAVSNACPIPDLDAEYPALDADRLLEDFEEYEATGDIVMGGGTTDGWQFEGNSAFRTQLDKTTPISGEKSLKISWTGLGEDVWGAHRLFMYHTGAFPMGNQAMTFTIKVDFDFTMTVAFYDMTGQPVQYTYTKVIQASDEPQTVTLPFNQFVNTNTSNYNYGSNVPADQWATYINQWLCFKIQIDRLSGLPENGEMWLDCFKLTTTEGPQEPAPAPILPDNPDNPGGGDPEDPEDPGVIVPDDPQPDDSDGFHVQQDFEEMTAADLTENFTSTPEGALTLDTAGALFGDNSLKMTYDLAGADSSTSFATAFPGLRGDGLYMQVLSANDALMTVRLDDGSLWVEYNIAITGSEEPQLVFANWVDTVAGRGTFDELNKAAVTMTVTLSSEEAVSGDIFLDNIGYFVYDEMLDTNEEEPPIVDPDDPTDPSDPTDPDDPTNPGDPSDPGEPVIPPTGEATAVATVTALGLTAAAVAAVTYRRRKTK